MLKVAGCVVLVWCMWGWGMVLQGRAFVAVGDVVCAMLVGRLVGACVGYGAHVVCARDDDEEVGDDDEDDQEVGVDQRQVLAEGRRRRRRRRLYGLSLAHDALSVAASVSYNQLSQLSGGNVALTSAFVSLSTYVPVLVGLCCFREKVGRVQAAGIAFAAAGGTLLSFSVLRVGEARAAHGLQAVLGLVAFVAWGCTYTIASSIYRVAGIRRVLRAYCVTALAMLTFVGAPLFRATEWFAGHTGGRTALPLLQLASAQFMWTSMAPVYTYVTCVCGTARGSALCSGYNAVPVVVGVTLLGNEVGLVSTVGITLCLCSVAMGSSRALPLAPNSASPNGSI
jgi:hypothetical protein